MRLIVTGQGGQVVRALIERAAALTDVQVIPVGRPALDLAAPDRIAQALDAIGADLIVNAAAHTAVDLAESEPEMAFAINEAGAGAVAAAARRKGVPVIQISTDYVFDGALDRPYVEQDAVGPLSVYGASKLAGEHAVSAANPDSAILRTSWVYSPFGKNFVATILRLAAERDELAIVDDQIGAPTSALDIADGVLAVARNLLERPGEPGLRGLFHMTAQGQGSWADFARSILDSSAALGGPTAGVRPIATAQFPTPARRPANSRLNCERLARVHDVRLPEWRSSVAAIVARRLAQSA